MHAGLVTQLIVLWLLINFCVLSDNVKQEYEGLVNDFATAWNYVRLGLLNYGKQRGLISDGMLSVYKKHCENLTSQRII
jgi:hypothetical protein